MPNPIRESVSRAMHCVERVIDPADQDRFLDTVTAAVRAECARNGYVLGEVRPSKRNGFSARYFYVGEANVEITMAGYLGRVSQIWANTFFGSRLVASFDQRCYTTDQADNWPEMGRVLGVMTAGALGRVGGSVAQGMRPVGKALPA